jgi:hypothetical protein
MHCDEGEAGDEGVSFVGRGIGVICLSHTSLATFPELIERGEKNNWEQWKRTLCSWGTQQNLKLSLAMT